MESSPNSQRLAEIRTRVAAVDDRQRRTQPWKDLEFMLDWFDNFNGQLSISVSGLETLATTLQTLNNYAAALTLEREVSREWYLLMVAYRDELTRTRNGKVKPELVAAT